MQATASRRVRGTLLPVPVGGHAALELVNTRAGWGEPNPVEYLTGSAALHRLPASLGLLPWRVVADLDRAAAADPRRATTVHRRALRLRESLHATLTGSADDVLLGRLDVELRRAGSARRLVGVGRTGGEWAWRGDGLDLPVLVMADAARDLLLHAGTAAVRACPGAGCGWLFLDPSGRRRWCSMRWCGNRAKVARHAANRSRSSNG